MRVRLSSRLFKLNRTTRLAFQVSIVNAIMLFLSLFLLVVSLNSTYKGEERLLAREKLSLMWTEMLTNDQRTGIINLRNIYERDLRMSRKSYGIRIANKKQQTLLLEYPDTWLKYSINGSDFLQKNTNVKKNPFRLKLRQNDREYSTNIDVYSLALGDYYLQVLVSVEERINFLISIGKRGIPILLGIILLSFIIASLAISRVLVPINNINMIVEKIIEKQNISQRLTETGRSEFARLQRNFNTMLDVIERQVSRLKHAAIHIGHDIRTPLTRVRNQLEEILGECHEQNAKDKLEKSLVFLDEIKIFTKQVLDLSEIESGSVHVPSVPVNVEEALEVVLDMYSIIAEEKQISLHTEISADAGLYIDAVRIRQMVGNLLDNAVKFTPPNKSIYLRVKDGENEVEIVVQDEGEGIAKEDLGDIWTPLWRKNTEETWRMNTGGTGGTELGKVAVFGGIKNAIFAKKGTAKNSAAKKSIAKKSIAEKIGIAKITGAFGNNLPPAIDANMGDNRRGTSGNGFGLSIVESIVKAYQGNIEVKSELGEGTVFRIVFVQNIT